MRVLCGSIFVSLLLSSSVCLGQGSLRRTSADEINGKIREIINPIVKSNNYSGSVLIQKSGKNIYVL